MEIKLKFLLVLFKKKNKKITKKKKLNKYKKTHIYKYT